MGVWLILKTGFSWGIWYEESGCGFVYGIALKWHDWGSQLTDLGAQGRWAFLNIHFISLKFSILSNLLKYE